MCCHGKIRLACESAFLLALQLRDPGGSDMKLRQHSLPDNHILPWHVFRLAYTDLCLDLCGV